MTHYVRDDARRAIEAIHFTRTTPWRRLADEGVLHHIVAPGWKELITPMSFGKAVGTRAAQWLEIGSTGFYAQTFEAQASEPNEQELFVTYHIPLDISTENGLNAEAIYPHFHWSPVDNAGGVVRWSFQFVYAPDGPVGGTFDFTDPMEIITEQEAGTTALKHLTIPSLPSVPVGQMAPDGIVQVRVRRNSAHANDTYTGNAIGWALGMDYHSDHHAQESIT